MSVCTVGFILQKSVLHNVTACISDNFDSLFYLFIFYVYTYMYLFIYYAKLHLLVHCIELLPRPLPQTPHGLLQPSALRSDVLD